MRIALISDIHGNDVALEAVLSDVQKQAVDQIIIMGDLVFKGPSPAKCVQLVQALNVPVVQGNIDEMVGKNWIQPGFAKSEEHATLLQAEINWTRAQLSQDELDFLATLPLVYEQLIEQSWWMRVVHATPQNVMDILLPTASEAEWGRMFARDGEEPRLVAYGHIHLPFMRSFAGKRIVNPGSVGLPFDGDWRASYAIVDVSKDGVDAVQHRRVAYSLEALAQRFEGTGHPSAQAVLAAIREGRRP